MSLHSGTSTQVPAASERANIASTIAAEVAAARATNAAAVALLRLALRAADRCRAWNPAPTRPPSAATRARSGS